MSLSRKAVAELIGTALLLAAVVGSGIMGERLADGNVAIALLANSIATGGALIALILTFGPISGAHLNPAVTLCLAASGHHAWRELPIYLVAQVVGAILGVWAAHAMFSEPVLQLSLKPRPGPALAWSEVIACFGLCAVILSGLKTRAEAIPYSVAAYITGAYWFTASTSFANPAVTIARGLSDTFAGISPADVPLFIASQLIGAGLAALLFAWFFRAQRSSDVLSASEVSS